MKDTLEALRNLAWAIRVDNLLSKDDPLLLAADKAIAAEERFAIVDQMLLDAETEDMTKAILDVSTQRGWHGLGQKKKPQCDSVSTEGRRCGRREGHPKGKKDGGHRFWKNATPMTPYMKVEW